MARRLLTAAMPERWPQVFRVKIMFELLLTICFVSTTTNSMKYLVNWNPRSFQNTLHFALALLVISFYLFSFFVLGKEESK